MPGESEMSPGLMKTQIITGIFFCAIRLSITFKMGTLPFRIDVAGAILKDHERGGRLWIVLRRHVDPVLALHAVVDFAGVDDLL